jgi:hypothetical protein
MLALRDRQGWFDSMFDSMKNGGDWGVFSREADVDMQRVHRD